MRSLRSNNLNGTSRGLAFRGEEEVRAREFFHRDVTHGGSTATQLVLGWTNFQMCKKKKKCVFLNVYEINIGGGGELLMDKNDRIARFEIVEK